MRFASSSLLTLFLFCLVHAQATGRSGAASVEGSVWSGSIRAPQEDGKLVESFYRCEFLVGNRLQCRYSGTTYTNNTWHQTGRAIRMEMNDGYSTWLGTIDGDRMSGNSANKIGHTWSWVLTRQTQEPGTTRTTLLPEWIKYSSAAGRFTILIPVEPKFTENQVDSAVGKLVNNVYMALTDAGAFAISYADYPANNADPQAVLDNVLDGAIKGIKGTSISSTNITHKGHPGREFQASTEGSVYTSRIFLVNNRLYQIVVVTAPGKVSAAEINRYLTSFDLKTNP
ncbi:MAG: hypothetical protein ACREBG_02355 [Pyrinomonadaceae bacterium]